MGAPRVLGFRRSTAVDMAAFSNAQRKALHDSGRASFHPSRFRRG